MICWKNIKATFCFFLAGIALFSCSILEPSIPAASYIRIDSISVFTDYATQGSSSNRLTDAWVFYDNEYLGTFPLPAEVPLIGEGSHSIIIRAGIVENGITGTRAAYPKYTSFDTTIVLVAGQKTPLVPAVTYGSGAVFAQLEDFDDASLSLVTTTTGNVPLIITPASDPNAFEGNSGWATLDTGHTVFEVASATTFVLPLNVPSYLELNYKADIDFSVGVFITTTTGIIKSDLLSIRATSSWKKIYVTLSTLGGVVSEGINYKIYLHAEKPSTVFSANLFFDNLKVVY